MKIQRRDFLKAAAAAIAFPSLRASAASPNGKVNMAFIGIGNRGYDDFAMFAYYKDLVNIVALCDTQMGAAHTERVLKMCPDAPRYQDFRKMLDEHARDIDAVCIATPDFSHFPAAMLAMSMGKAVYCEKPMGNCFREIGLMSAAARRHKVVTQMGNQGHSDANYWQMKSLVEHGWIKDVTRIDAFMCSGRRWFKWNGTEMPEMPGEEAEPAEMDWDVWLSQRPFRPFNHNFINGDWRCFYEYGTGALGDWGAHIFDAAHEFLKLGLPERITFKGEGCNKFVFPMSSTICFHFPARGEMPPCVLEWRDGINNRHTVDVPLTAKKWTMPDNGAELYLADGRVFSRGTHDSPVFLIAGGDPNDPAVKKTLRDYRRGAPTHHKSFLLAVKGEDKTTSPFSVGGPLSQVLSLGVIAQQLEAPELRFDVNAKRFVGNDAANALLEAPKA